MAEVFNRKKKVQDFFGTVEHKGERKKIDLQNINQENPELFYQHQNGELWLGDSIEWLKGLEENSVDLIFADPPYNIKKAFIFFLKLNINIHGKSKINLPYNIKNLK